jgi:hypothetical protein
MAELHTSVDRRLEASAGVNAAHRPRSTERGAASSGSARPAVRAPTQAERWPPDTGPARAVDATGDAVAS